MADNPTPEREIKIPKTEAKISGFIIGITVVDVHPGDTINIMVLGQNENRQMKSIVLIEEEIQNNSFNYNLQKGGNIGDTEKVTITIKVKPKAEPGKTTDWKEVFRDATQSFGSESNAPKKSASEYRVGEFYTDPATGERKPVLGPDGIQIFTWESGDNDRE